MKKGFFLSTVTLLSLAALAGCGGGGGGSSSSGGTINIGEVKVWCDEKVVPTATTQLEAFKKEHSNYEISFKIEPMSESSAAGDMITDPKAGADVYFFAQDQLSRLITAKAISDLGSDAKATVTANNDAASVAAATVDGKVYAYPATSDNTYFLYYDNTVFSEDDVKDLSTMVTKAKAAGKTIYFETGSAWYNASFFYGAGCHSEWTVDSKGNFVDYDDNYKSDKGKIALQGMQILTKESSVHVNSSENGAFAKGAAALVSGTWAKSDVQTALGSKMGVTVLPKYKVGNGVYQLTSFSGFKLVGTKPQTTADRAKAVSEIALALTSEAAQLERFEKLGWGPSNKAAQNNDAVKADPTLKAVFAQNNLATPQGQYPGGWWDLAGAMGKNLGADADLDNILKTYNDGLDGLKS